MAPKRRAQPAPAKAAMLRGETPADAAARRGECVRECVRPCVRDAAATELRGAVRRSAAQQRLPQSVTNEVTDLVMKNQRDALYLFIRNHLRLFTMARPHTETSRL